MTAALKKAEKALCKQGGPAEVPIHNVIFYNDKGVLKYKMAQGSSRSEELGTDMAKISFEVKKLLDTGIIMDLGKPKEARSARPKTTSATPAAAGGAAAAAAADVDDDDDDDDDVSAPMAAKTISAPGAHGGQDQVEDLCEDAREARADGHQKRDGRPGHALGGWS